MRCSLKRQKQKEIIFKIDFEKAYDTVSWCFLFEVLERKNFPLEFINWIKAYVMGGRVYVNMNGVRSEVFRTYRGLRQGDPLPPILFNLVSDTLASVFDRAKDFGWLSDLTPQLVPGGLTHHQYVDDTVIFMPFDDAEILTSKFLLYCFEDMSALKTNYYKNEVFTVGLGEEDQNKVAMMLNCPIGVFPMKYPGLPISLDKILNRDLSYISQKVEKRSTK